MKKIFVLVLLVAVLCSCAPTGFEACNASGRWKADSGATARVLAGSRLITISDASGTHTYTARIASMKNDVAVVYLSNGERVTLRAHINWMQGRWDGRCTITSYRAFHYPRFQTWKWLGW